MPAGPRRARSRSSSPPPARPWDGWAIPRSSALPAPFFARSRLATSPGRRWASTAALCSEFIRIRSVAIKFAERMSHLGTESAFEVLAKARRLEAEGKRIVHLEIGEPDFATPDNIVEAGISPMQNRYTHSTPAAGDLQTGQALAG